MKRRMMTVGFVTAVVAAAIAMVLVTRPAHVTAQQSACLHGPDETAEQKQRRQQALSTARQINTAQARMSGGSRVYHPMSDLGNITVASGFKVQLASDGSSYSFSVKDTLDPCRFAFFSDQDGIIFNASPIQ